MAHYSIYIPRGQGTSPTLLANVGLDELQQRCSWSWAQVDKGPDGDYGTIGTVISHRKKSSTLIGYHENLQTWVPIGNRPDLELEKGSFWFGYETDSPPTPYDLAHRSVILGRDVVLKDGGVWHIPETLNLPLDIGRDPESGELVKLYSKEFKDFSRMAERYVFIFFENIIKLEELRELRPDLELGEINAEFDLVDSWEYCCKALSINYRVAELIVGPGMLDLLDDRLMANVVMASLAMPDILEVIEKKKIVSPVSIPVGLNI